MSTVGEGLPAIASRSAASLHHTVSVAEISSESEKRTHEKANAPGVPGFLGRFAIAFVAASIATALRLSIDGKAFYDISFLAPFIAVALSAMSGGWAPGLFATAMIMLGEAMLLHRHHPALPGDPGMKLLCEGGVLLSVVGGLVFSARSRARASDIERLDLERKVLEISDEERRRIGHDLHDGLGQHLTGISLLSASLAQRIDAGSTNTARDADKISLLVTEAIGWTRDLARGLSPVTLESDGLVAALEELADNTRSLLGVECSCRSEGGEPLLDRQRALHIFRIVQEAVSNSVKHGKAKLIHITLVVRDQTLTAQVVDDGCGLSAKTKANPGLGLRIMNYRARMVGAVLSVDRANRLGGTLITCRCPILPVQLDGSSGS